MQYTPITVAETARRYGIATATLRKWLADMPDGPALMRRRTLMPAEVARIVAHCGEWLAPENWKQKRTRE